MRREFPERFEEAADETARHMRAIVMQPLCLVCHGAADLRDAFVVEWRPGDSR